MVAGDFCVYTVLEYDCRRCVNETNDGFPSFIFWSSISTRIPCFVVKLQPLCSQYFQTIYKAAKYVSEIVGHKVEAGVNTVSQALDDYIEEDEEDNPDVFCSFHEFAIID